MGEKGSCKAHWRGSKVRHKTGWWSLFSKLVGSEVGGRWHDPTTVLHKHTNTKHSCVAVCYILHNSVLCSREAGGWLGGDHHHFTTYFSPDPRSTSTLTTNRRPMPNLA